MKNLFITGIGTDVGKTFASAILVQAFGFDYWKPIQAGNLENTDSDQIRNLVVRKDFHIYPEAFRLEKAMSPHTAANFDKKTIRIEKIQLPVVGKHLIIEGAGGVMVPLNNNETIIDFIQTLAMEVVIVSRNYLGSINHSLLTFEALDRRNIPVLGWIFNGENENASEEIITEKSGKPTLLQILPEKKISQEVIIKYAKRVVNNGKFI